MVAPWAARRARQQKPRSVPHKNLIEKNETLFLALSHWKNLTDDVNVMASNLTAQVRSIAQVARAVERGDPSQQRSLIITVHGRGTYVA
jgi:hypothetical protein